VRVAADVHGDLGLDIVGGIRWDRAMVKNPLSSVAMIYLTDSEGVASYGGSAFLFRRDEIALTAAHCVPRGVVSVGLHFPLIRSTHFPVVRIERHPTADLAALFIGEVDLDGEGYPEYAYWNHLDGNYSMGEAFYAFGYPIEGPGQGDVAQEPTPRMFVGNYQRFFDYSLDGRSPYRAGEMSIPAPGGLSGGPVFRPGTAPGVLVTGLVTTNSESYAITDSFEDIDQDGRRLRTESRRIISYGIALLLDQFDDWLNTVAPHRKGTAFRPN
jgi:hypothetical protein